MQELQQDWPLCKYFEIRSTQQYYNGDGSHWSLTCIVAKATRKWESNGYAAILCEHSQSGAHCTITILSLCYTKVLCIWNHTTSSTIICSTGPTQHTTLQPTRNTLLQAVGWGVANTTHHHQTTTNYNTTQPQRSNLLGELTL